MGVYIDTSTYATVFVIFVIQMFLCFRVSFAKLNPSVLCVRYIVTGKKYWRSTIKSLFKVIENDEFVWNLSTVEFDLMDNKYYQ